MNWRMWKLSKPWNFIADFHSEERHLVTKTMLFHFQTEKIGDEFALKTSWAVVLDHFNHAVLDFLVIKNFLFEIICVQPFDSRFWNWLMRYVSLIYRLRVIHKFVNYFGYLLSGILYFKNITIKLFYIWTLRVIDWHSLTWVNYIYMWKFKRQLLHINHLCSFLLIITIINIKHPIIVPQDALKLLYNVWHNLLTTRQQQQWFVIWGRVLDLSFEFFHIGV